MGKGNPPSHKSEWDRGFPVLGAFKLDHLHPFKLLLFWEFSNFFTFILGGQFLLPQRANNGKREFFQPQKWMRQRVFSALDIQTGPFASLLTPFVQGNFHVFTFILGGQFLLPQRANNRKREFFQPQNWMRVGFECLCHSNWTICIPLSPFSSWNFPTFHFHEGGLRQIPITQRANIWKRQ